MKTLVPLMCNTPDQSVTHEIALAAHEEHHRALRVAGPCQALL